MGSVQTDSHPMPCIQGIWDQTVWSGMSIQLGMFCDSVISWCIFFLPFPVLLSALGMMLQH